MPGPSRAEIEAALEKSGLLANARIESADVESGRVTVVLAIERAFAAAAEKLRPSAEAALKSLPGAASASIVFTAHREPHTHAHEQPRPAARELAIPGVKSLIAVASGKGGVGKSTVAVNLAVALSRQGKKIGLLDADIYGPSVPHLLGLAGRKPESDGKKLQPMLAHGLKAMSIGFLIDVDTPMIWRGPMVVSALSQLMTDVDWGELDVLVMDLPPGTGDAQLTIAQRVRLSGAVIVSTPQDIALIDARKALAMFRKTQVPILGIVENMSTFICPHCGEATPIFGHGGARETAQQLDAPFLGEIPLTLALRETSDAGTPIAAAAPGGAEAKAFAALATQVWAALASGAHAKPAPKIVIQ